MPVDLPFMGDRPQASARIKVSPEHFKVEEILDLDPMEQGIITCLGILRSIELVAMLRAS